MKFILFLWSSIFLLATVAIDESWAKQVQQVNTNNKDSILEHLSSLGFGEKKDSRGLQRMLDKDNALKESILKYQKFHRLKETGIIDKDTAKLMTTPRCGLPDLVEKRVAALRARWRKKDLTYEILNDYPGLNVKEIIENAFSEWSKVSALKFKQLAKNGDLKILFAPGNHNDDFPFDGKGGVLAHAFFPEDGKVHFDGDEKFTHNSEEGTNLFMVAVHELGHSLGLDHNNVPGSIMNPYYTGYIPNYKLGDYDAKLIQDLYGVNPAAATTTKSTTTTTTTKSTSSTRHSGVPTTKSATIPDLPIKLYCLTSKKSILMTYIHGQVFILDQNKVLWHFDTVKMKLEPHYHSNDFKKVINESGIVGTVDDQNVKWFFKGQNVWAFQNQTLKAGYPKKFIISKGVFITFFTGKIFQNHLKTHGLSFSNYDAISHLQEFPEIIFNQMFPSHFNMDVALYKNKHLYLIKEHIAYEYDKNANKIMSVVLLNKLFPGLPDEIHITSILSDHGFFYLFTKDTVYKFDEKANKIVDGYPKKSCDK